MNQDLTHTPLGGFLDALASAEPTPGGGAAAALAGATAAALISMVCNLTVGRPRYADVDAAMQAIRGRSESARARLVALADADARAYGAVAAAYRLPRATADERSRRVAAIQTALVGAAQPPLEAMDVSRTLVTLALETAAHGNSTVASDAGVAADLAAAAVRASATMVRANLAELTDPALLADYSARIDVAEAGLTVDLDRIAAVLRAKLAPKVKS